MDWNLFISQFKPEFFFWNEFFTLPWVIVKFQWTHSNSPKNKLNAQMMSEYYRYAINAKLFAFYSNCCNNHGLEQENVWFLILFIYVTLFFIFDVPSEQLAKCITKKWSKVSTSILVFCQLLLQCPKSTALHLEIIIFLCQI